MRKNHQSLYNSPHFTLFRCSFSRSRSLRVFIHHNFSWYTMCVLCMCAAVYECVLLRCIRSCLSFMCGRSCLRSRNYVLSLLRARVCEFFSHSSSCVSLSFVRSLVRSKHMENKHVHDICFRFSMSKKVSWESSFEPYRRVNSCVPALRLVNINVKYASENLTLPHGKHRHISLHYARNIINAKVKVDKSI